MSKYHYRIAATGACHTVGDDGDGDEDDDDDDVDDYCSFACPLY